MRQYGDTPINLRLEGSYQSKGGAYAATRNYRRSDSRSGEGTSWLYVGGGNATVANTSLVRRVRCCGISEPVWPLAADPA